MSNYRTIDVAVRGGNLRTGCWFSDDAVDRQPDRIVLALHGITSSQLAWSLVAEQLAATPSVLVLAPDLRGRGRSTGLPGPWGMAQHAEDVAAVLRACAPGRSAVVAGHSMGGFVAVLLAATAPELVSSLVLVDGGIPLVLPAGWTLEAAVQVGLGPAAERLSMTFEDQAAYRDFWRKHPAFDGEFSAAVADYVDYDLRPDGPPWRSSSDARAMTADHAELFTGGPVEHAWPRLDLPVSFLRAPRGLQDEPGGMYPPPVLEDWASQHPGFQWQDVAGVNHYTITLGERGASAVSAAVIDQFRFVPDLAKPAG
ncbi:MAG: alpha/beta hydrolase [Jatrophihabitantaceae bacterium]